MAKENVAKFYEKLAEDTALAEKLNALDKEFAEKNEAVADGADIREKAAEAIVLPLVSRLVHIHNNCPICSHLRCHRQLA